MGVVALAIPLLVTGAASVLGLGTVATSLLILGSSLAVGLFSRERIGADAAESIEIRLRNTRNTISKVPVVYGTTKVGGNDIFISVQPSDPKYLWVVQTLSEGECEGIEQYEDNDLIFINNKLVSSYPDDLITYTFHNGSNTQVVDTNLHNEFSDWTDPLRNTAYIVFRFKYDKQYFNGIPLRHIVLKGKKIFDFNTETFTFSNNPVRILYDYLTNIRYGLGIPTNSFNISEWLAVSNDIQSLGWGFDSSFAQNTKAQDIIELILTHFRGVLTYFDGIFTVSETEYAPFTDVIRDSDIAVNSDNIPNAFLNQNTKGNIPDGVQVKYITKTENWSDVNVDILTIGDKRGRIDTISYLGCLNKVQAGDLALYNFERLRLSRIITLVLRDSNIIYSPNDIVGLVCSELGIGTAADEVTNEIAIPHRIVESNVLVNGQLQLTLLQEDPSLYDKDFDPDPGVIYELSFPDPTEEPPGVEDFAVQEVLYTERERSKIKLECTFLPPNNYPWFSHANVSLGINSQQFANYLRSTGRFYVNDVIEGNTYFFKVQSVSDYGVVQEKDFLIYQYVVKGVTDSLPRDPSKLTVTRHNGSVTLSTPSLLDYTDIAAYEYRFGPSWNTSIFIDRVLAPTLTLGDVKPSAIVYLDPFDVTRAYKFWVNTVGQNGLYGKDPKSAVLFMQNPPIGLSAPTTGGRRPLLSFEIPDGTIEVFDPSPWSIANLSSSVDYANISVDDTIYIINGTGNIRDTLTVVAKLVPSPPYLNRLQVSGATQAWPAGTDFLYDTTDRVITYNNMSLVNIGGDRYLECSHENGRLSGTVTIENIPAFTTAVGSFYCMYDYLITGVGEHWYDVLANSETVSVGTITVPGTTIATLSSTNDYNEITGWVIHVSIGTITINTVATPAQAFLSDSEGDQGDWDHIQVNSRIMIGPQILIVVSKDAGTNSIWVNGVTATVTDVPFLFTGVPDGQNYGTVLSIPYPNPTAIVSVVLKVDPNILVLETPQTFTAQQFSYEGPCSRWRDFVFSPGYYVSSATITVDTDIIATISTATEWDKIEIGDYITVAYPGAMHGPLVDFVKVVNKFAVNKIQVEAPGFRQFWVDYAFVIDSNPRKWKDFINDKGAGFKLNIDAEYIDGTSLSQQAARLELLNESYNTAPLTINTVTIYIEDPLQSTHLRIRDNIEIQNAPR